jgi:hypothetical protein|mmetsp:Transcript_2685/g.5040  ORF Transcript_2685/g.5040 Transcript_2685/m.5040 type:complete len:117 (+) Transcript_2685:184-534(+)
MRPALTIIAIINHLDKKYEISLPRRESTGSGRVNKARVRMLWQHCFVILQPLPHVSPEQQNAQAVPTPYGRGTKHTQDPGNVLPGFALGTKLLRFEHLVFTAVDTRGWGQAHQVSR